MHNNKSNLIHLVLGHSYFVNVAGLLIGLLIDLFHHVRFYNTNLSYIGFLLIFVGPILIYWAQHTSRSGHHHKREDGPIWQDFAHGPYKLTRAPTHLGIALMILGLGFILGSYAVVITTLVAFAITRSVFIGKEEAILVEKFGDPYRTYQKKVRM